MPTEGGWRTREGQDLRELSVRLTATGQRGLRLRMNAAMRASTAGAAQAVRNEVEAIMPKAGGLNDWLGAAPIRTQILTGSRTAGVRLTAQKLRRANSGFVRHPVFGNTAVWATTQVPAGWWEKTLDGFAPRIEAALLIAMREAAREAGFE